jgi:TonB family protein
MRGLAHADNALAIDPDYLEAVIYKGLLLRLKARDARDPSEQERLLGEAYFYQRKGELLRKAGVRPREDPYAAFFPAIPPPPPPAVPSAPPMPSLAPPPSPPPAGPVRVGGAIKEPKKVKHANPVYPMIAREARIQGVVILECVIGADGRVEDIRVLRGIPLLDQAAVDAVRQWEYVPTYVNGVPVPVIMTVTVQFRLS